MADPDESFAVIGGEGFLGQHLVKGLQEANPDHKVASLGLTQRTFTPGYRFYRTDITSLESVTKALKLCGATTVFHAASAHGDAPKALQEAINVEGTKAVLEACRATGVTKLVYTSTVTIVLDEGESLVNVDERLPPRENNSNPYVATKAVAERLVLEANGQGGLYTCSLRPCGIIGPGERQVVPGFLGVLKSRQTNFQIGDNTNLYDFVHVSNVVDAHILAASKLTLPALSPAAFDTRLRPVYSTVPRRDVPTSQTADLTTPFPESQDDLLPESRSRYKQFSDLSHDVGVAGEAFIITNGEPVPFWSFARSLWFAYNGHVPWLTVVIPAGAGMALAQMAEAYAWVRRIPSEKLGISKGRMQYVLGAMYFDIEKARRVLGYEPRLSLEQGIKDSVEWYKQEEARQTSQK